MPDSEVRSPAFIPCLYAMSRSSMIQAWVGDMSAYLKSVDPNHLVTVGEEGFWGYYDSHISYNPENSVSPWAALTGNNFTAPHAFEDIDYTAVHYWPNLWVSCLTSHALVH